MIITRATEYSIRAALYLAEKYPAQVVSKQEICEAEGITPAFLTKILQPLIHAGLVRSKRGVSGGFALAKDPSRLTLLDVMEAAEEPMLLNICLMENHPCERECTCPVHKMWAEAKEKLSEIFSRRTLAELVEERKRLRARAGECT
ncbi:RrF2 family transcriptional regulator [Deferrisoma palaeochoriense]